MGGLPHQPFQIIELNEFFSELALGNESANEIRMRCKGHFLIFGDAVQRKERGKNLHVLKLQGIVCHAPISDNDQSALAREMGSVLPLRAAIPEEDELSGFEITSLQMAEATKYVIATAALLSRDYEFAIALLEELQHTKDKLNINSNVKPIRKLIGLIPVRLADAYKFASIDSFVRWEKTRSNSDLQKSINWIAKFDKLNPNENLHILLVRAIGHFIFSRDIEAASKYISRCRAKYIAEPTWKYSAAFLEAYRNNLDKAKQLYDAAKPTESGYVMPFQIEGFIAWILDIEPQQKQLNFCLGYLNEIFKQDMISARQYYSNFLSPPCNEDFSKSAIEHAKKFMVAHKVEVR